MYRFNLAPVLRIGAVVKYSPEGLRPYRDLYLNASAYRPGWRASAHERFIAKCNARGVIYARSGVGGWAVVWGPRKPGNARPAVSCTSSYLLEAEGVPTLNVLRPVVTVRRSKRPSATALGRRISRASCPQCGGTASLLGALGSTIHVRCRSCGWDWSL